MKDKDVHILFEKLKNDDKDALEELYNKVKETVYGIAFSIIKNKENSEDIVQNVFIKILRMPKENLPSDYEMSWLYSVTKNETLNYLKKLKPSANIEEVYNISNDDKDIIEIVDKDFYNRLIKKLDRKQQEIISLKIIAEMNFRQISEMLNIPIGTVQWRYYKAIGSLKMLISNLSIFIVSLVISAKVLVKEKLSIFQNNIKKNEQIIKNEENNEDLNRDEEKVKGDVIENSYSKENATLEDSKSADVINDENLNQEKEKIESDISKETTQNIIENFIKDENLTDNQNTENVIIDNKNLNENLYLKNTLAIGINIIFFVLTIISLVSFIIFQQKTKKKLSK